MSGAQWTELEFQGVAAGGFQNSQVSHHEKGESASDYQISNFEITTREQLGTIVQWMSNSCLQFLIKSKKIELNYAQLSK